MDNKRCSKCKVIKNINEFHKNKSRKDGYSHWCKTCNCKDSKLYRENNRDKVRESSKKWSKANPERVKAIYKKWYKNNPDKVREFRSVSKKKRSYSLKNRLNNLISNEIRKSLKGNKKGLHWENLVNYTLQELMDHLEKQFKDGMTWGNRFDWHIDHIRPIASFNYNSYEDREFKECWALANLQPLWPEENLKKGIDWKN